MPTTEYKNAKGERLSGVTTIIGSNLGWSKGALMYWAWDQGRNGKNFREESEKAADAGTICHAMIEADIKDRVFDPSRYDKALVDKAETGFLNFLEWKKMVNLRTFATEVHLVSEKHQYGATPDCIGVVIDKLALVDWKTSNGVYEDHLIQLAAYKVVWEEVHPDQPLTGGFHLLRVAKESGSFHHHHWDSLLEPWQAFLNLLELHKLKGKIKKLK